MKTYLYLLIILPIVFIDAQKIKVKNEDLLYDKVVVAHVKKVGKDSLDFYDLNGNKSFNAYLNYMRDQELDESYYWLTLISADGSASNDVDYSSHKGSFNFGTIVSDLLATQLTLIDESGINESELNAFFAEPKEDMEVRYKQEIKDKKERIAKEKAALGNLRNENNPKIDEKGKLYYNNSWVGLAKYYQNSGSVNKKCIDFVDLDGNIIGSVYYKFNEKYNLKNFKNETFDYATKSNYVENDAPFATFFYERLLLQGFRFGHEINKEIKKEIATQLKAGTRPSVKINNQPGYVTDENGDKYEGTLTIEFKDATQVESEDFDYMSLINKDNSGQVVKLKYINDDGDNDSKLFEAKDNNSFCVKSSGSESCYYGLSVKGEAERKLQNMANLQMNSAYYYLLIDGNDDIMLLQDPVETEKYVLKISSEKKGQMIDIRTEDELKKAVSKYLSECPQLSKDIKNGKYDLKSESDLKSIIQTYSQCN